MKRKNVLGFLLVMNLMVFSIIAQAGELIKGMIPGDIYGELIICAFPNKIVLDGKLNDQAWKYATWHRIEAKDGTVTAPDNDNASVKFAVTADDKYIYFAAEITDNKIIKGESATCNVYNDDSVEAYIDAGNEKAGAYDINDAQITIGADTIGADPDVKTTAALLGGCVGITQGPKTETIATGTLTKDGWNVEAAIPLKNSGWDIKPQNGLIIGFNVQYNDDDSGGDRDYKLIWCKEEVKKGEGSWTNPSLFAELKFVEAALAVDPKDKIAAKWAIIKAFGE
ncbi:MAG: Carb-bd dom fam9 protein [Candidatus Poribacteria bacterium]|nr:Carb-bd dom fam9 protein [Candidatus Poribacteria bacterium]